MKHYLEHFFQPHSIAVIGASDRVNSVGMKVFKNLLQQQFLGKLYAINPKHTTVQGQASFSSVKQVNDVIDLAIITTPATTVPGIIKDCGKKGIHAAVVISSGFSEAGAIGKDLEQKMLKLAQQYHIRIIGPNCLGIMHPALNMNASFDNNTPSVGSIGLVSQSGAICAAILDWAVSKKIGFSNIISLGNCADVDFGDSLDYLALDPETKSILLYIEGIKNARRFMSGLRAASRSKPVIVIKGGRNHQGSRAALSHTGAIVGNDDVFDAALRRAGVVRVMTIQELFSAAEILSCKLHAVKGNRLMIITNGGGAGVMAADQASELHLTLPQLNDNLLDKLNLILPPQWSHQNPIDIIGDATPERYHQTLEACAQEEVDGILTLLVPVAMSNPLRVAKQVIKDAKTINKLVLACWMGENQVKSAWKLFAKHSIPYFDTPEKAVSAFSYLANFYHHQQLLLQIPGYFVFAEKPHIAEAKTLINRALSQKRSILTAVEAKKILSLFLIPVSEPKEAKTKEEALVFARQLGFPLVMKINSPDISHKQEAQGVILNITNETGVEQSFDQLIQHAKQAFPEANILGVTLESMFNGVYDREVMIGVMSDKVFGPVISFGLGGIFVEVLHDRSLALPPLNQFLAERLIHRTRIAKALGAFRGMPAVNMDLLIHILLRISEMICALPEIQEMDINPIIINDKTAVAVDARMVIASALSHKPFYHMAIHPYPDDLVTSCEIAGKKIILRPIRQEDAEMEQTFIRNLSPETKYFRFIENINELPLAMLVRFTHIDYDREMAFVACQAENGEESMIGIVSYTLNADGETAEFSIVVADSWQDKGLGSKLMDVLIKSARNKGLKGIEGVVLAANQSMLEFAKHHGFEIIHNDDPTLKIIKLNLSPLPL